MLTNLLFRFPPSFFKAVEWYYLLQSITNYDATGVWAPQVSLADGLSAVEIGLQATQAIVNEQENNGGDDASPFRHTHSMPV